ncbi:hypothetical protein OBE_15107 [human gut metagenome]|jgi:hypothetical protein|uniref:Uncharacterized protein n=2 Tax=root TaxID=1 RepID=B0MVC2_9BACT|nr:hypothetical protein ALIPUT_01069 [Alistipes putredinis DSM 17216]
MSKACGTDIYGAVPGFDANASLPGGLFGVIPYVGPGLLSVLENRLVEGVGEA